MKSISFGLLCLALVGVLGGAMAAQEKKPDASVMLAKSWTAAVEEAKLLNVPIVVHSHGFYCPPCWGMHSAVMQNKKYIEFANENTVEVIALSRLDEGTKAGDRKAGTYKAKGPDGQEVEYMLEFPGLTYQDMMNLNSSKASSYNNTGKIPYTCLVDPWTEKEIVNWSGGQSAKSIIEAVEKAKKDLVAAHGKGINRSEIKKIDESVADAAKFNEAGEFGKALEALNKVSAKSANWPEMMQTKVAEQKQAIVESATAAFEGAKNLEPAKAKKEVQRLISKLGGTGLEKDAKEFLKSLANQGG